MYEHKGQKLYFKKVKLTTGYISTIYFFSRKEPKSGELCECMPDGYKVMESKTSNNFIYLKKK